jgi:hypothetical protein
LEQHHEVGSTFLVHKNTLADVGSFDIFIFIFADFNLGLGVFTLGPNRALVETSPGGST